MAERRVTSADWQERKVAEARVGAIHWLVQRYLAARDTPGPDYRAAHADLAAALREHGSTVGVESAGRRWRWSPRNADIVSEPIYQPQRGKKSDAPTPHKEHKVAWTHGYEENAGQRVESEWVRLK